MSTNTKYLLAALSLALVKAGEVLSEHSEYFDNEGNYVGPDGGDNGTIIQKPQITPAQIVAATGSDETDSDGLPWDARIHASTKTKTQKGAWTRRKGVDDATFGAVIAELRGGTAPAAPVVPTPTAPVVPTVTAPVVPTVTAPVVPLTPFVQLTDWLAKNTGPGKALSQEWITSTLTSNGMSLPELATNQEAATAFLEAFRGALASMGVAEVA